MMDIRNPIFADETGDSITCEIKLDGAWLPFNARPDDVEAHGRAAYAAALAMGPGAYVPPPPPGPADLSPAQFEYLLALTGFGEVWDGIAAQAKASGDMATYAALMAERRRTVFLLDVVLSVVAQFSAAAAQIAPEVDLSETAIRAAWAQAEGYGGLGNG